jgi:hypothetical protein
MVRNGPNRRKRGGIWSQLGVSACMILLPPLVMAAGVIVFGSSSQRGGEPGGQAQQAAASQTVVTKSVLLAERTDGVTSFALARAEQQSVITEQYPVAENRPGTEQPSATAQGRASGQSRVAKDPSPYDVPLPITTSEQPAVTNSTQYHEVRASVTGRYAHSRLSCQPQDGTARVEQRLSGEAGPRPSIE